MAAGVFSFAGSSIVRAPGTGVSSVGAGANGAAVIESAADSTELSFSCSLTTATGSVVTNSRDNGGVGASEGAIAEAAIAATGAGSTIGDDRGDGSGAGAGVGAAT